LVVAYSTVDHNSATYGGGIAGHFSAGIVGGSTVASNTAHVGGGVFNYSIGGSYGGRIFDSTISGNSSDQAGGGITLFYGDAYSSILANSDAPADTYNVYLYGIGSLIENPGSTVYGVGNITGADPQLAGLANNGGNTPTLKPAAGSPVVDKGFSYAYYDQRGFPFARVVDNPNVSNAFPPPYGAADMGSVELTLAEGPQAQPPAPPPVVPPHKKKKKCKKKKHHRSAQVAKKKCKKKKKKRRSSRPTAQAIKRWRESGQVPGGDRHWGDHAWRFRH
jgi:hypothetical protein